VLIEPGDVCVSARSDGTAVTEMTYEQIRDGITQRRILTLVVSGLVLVVTGVAAVTVFRRRGRRARTAA
jgi:hypothetical protein